MHTNKMQNENHGTKNWNFFHLIYYIKEDFMGQFKFSVNSLNLFNFTTS